MMKKRGAVSYVWIFSLIIGALILFLAIFSAQKFTETSSLQEQRTLVRQFDILLDPFASVGSIATMTLSKSVSMATDVQINFRCSKEENYNEVNLRTKTRGEWNKWPIPGFKIRDKYVFSESLEGKDFWVFAKQFEMPWRVDDLIYIADQSYCFNFDIENAPQNMKPELEAIKREVEALQSDVIAVEGSCIPGSKDVCIKTSHGRRDCSINVFYDLGLVKKDGESIPFIDNSLMYGIILSDPEFYDCNLNRLLRRARTQTEINLDKAKVMEQKGCNTRGLQSSLEKMKTELNRERIIIGELKRISEEVEKNNPKECAVF
ncbi:hypothetical protein ACFLZZ_03010 [Nanoarchaeota archaeon]